MTVFKVTVGTRLFFPYYGIFSANPTHENILILTKKRRGFSAKQSPIQIDYYNQSELEDLVNERDCHIEELKVEEV